MGKGFSHPHHLSIIKFMYIVYVIVKTSAGNIMKTHVRGFFDTDLHEVNWHFATHEAVRPSGF